MFHTAIKRADKSEDVKERVNHLIDSITYSVFMYTARGLFERDKLTFIAQVAFQVRSLQVSLYPAYIYVHTVVVRFMLSVCVCVVGHCTK